MSEEEVAKDPQINFEYFGYMSDSDGEGHPQAGQGDGDAPLTTRRSGAGSDTGRGSLVTEQITSERTGLTGGKTK